MINSTNAMYPHKTTHPIVCFGEILWDILPHAKLPGAAPLNMAYHLSRPGKNPAVISHIGNDETLDFACTVGAFVATCAGGCPGYNIENIYALMNKKEDKQTTIFYPSN